MRLPSGLNAALFTPASWPLSGAPIGWPVAASHSRAVLSSDAVTMRLPSGLNAALYTRSSWPSSGAPIGWPVAASHSRAVLSPDAVTMRLPSGLNAALYTTPSWPLSGAPIGLPVSASHSRAVLSSDAVTMRLPSGLNAALSTVSWPARTIRSRSACQAPSSCKLRLGHIGSSDSGRGIGQRLEREQERRSGVARRALLAREIGQEQRLRRLRLLELGLGAGLRGGRIVALAPAADLARSASPHCIQAKPPMIAMTSAAATAPMLTRRWKRSCRSFAARSAAMLRCTKAVTSGDRSSDRVGSHSSARARSRPVQQRLVGALHRLPAPLGPLGLALEHQEVALLAQPLRQPRPGPQQRLVRDLGDDPVVGLRARPSPPAARDDRPGRRRASIPPRCIPRAEPGGAPARPRAARSRA